MASLASAIDTIESFNARGPIRPVVGLFSGSCGLGGLLQPAATQRGTITAPSGLLNDVRQLMRQRGLSILSVQWPADFQRRYDSRRCRLSHERPAPILPLARRGERSTR